MNWSWYQYMLRDKVIFFADFPNFVEILRFFFFFPLLLCEGGGQQRSAIPKPSQTTSCEWGTMLGSFLFTSLAPMTTCGPTRPGSSLIWTWMLTAKKRWGKVLMPPTRKVPSALYRASCTDPIRGSCLYVFDWKVCVCSRFDDLTLCDCWFSAPALEEAAVRFRELQAEKELRQLQEDRKNDRKPPPYKHIKVREMIQGFCLVKTSLFVFTEVKPCHTFTFNYGFIIKGN